MRCWKRVLAIGWLALSACEPTSGPGPPAIAPEVAARLYARHCALCHGADGDGRGVRRQSLFRKPPDFRSRRWRRSRTATEVRRAIRDGIAGSDMPSWKRLGEAAIAGLADHVMALGDEGPTAPLDAGRTRGPLASPAGSGQCGNGRRP
jgi:mono/diheme cytochrome c family protein